MIYNQDKIGRHGDICSRYDDKGNAAMAGTCMAELSANREVASRAYQCQQ